MGIKSSIEWCDSTLNLQMGCDGCELWNTHTHKCYAGVQIDGEPGRVGRAGYKGWPAAFNKPELFLDRLEPALKWQDLTGKKRQEKPWLDGLPRIVFLNDMGDTFTKGLPLNWLAPLLPRLADSPHIYMLLTKRPSRMAQFSERFPFPKNFWLGTTVTSNATVPRVDQLAKCQGGSLYFVSIEPIWEDIQDEAFVGMNLIIFGGESGADACGTCMDHILRGVRKAHEHGAKAFVKQLGSRPYFMASPRDGLAACAIPFHQKHSHGGDMEEWPYSLRIREFPTVVKVEQPALL